MMGTVMEPASMRIARLGEAVALLKLFFAGEMFSFSGRFYDVKDAIASPAAVQSPRPPIVLGGGGPRMLTLAAAEADVVTLNVILRSGDMVADRSASGTDAQVRERIALIRDVSGRRFDDIELGLYVHMCRVGERAASAASDVAAAMGMSTEDALASPHVLVGTHDEVTAKLQRIRDEYRISYFSIDNDATGSFAPIVERLAGT
jgi:alkanesulfonate monooxygenase SsuD/methylene tetrahydromethanopterin reductase-like flavin-dependent oxidoreductase (luciferase family)